MPRCDNEKRKFKLIIAAGVGLGEDNKVARMWTGISNVMVNQRFGFVFVFCSKSKPNSSRLAENLLVEGAGRGQISEMPEQRQGIA